MTAEPLLVGFVLFVGIAVWLVWKWLLVRWPR
jgi:hypothetical protein